MSFNQSRNLSDRLIKIIEANAEELTKGTVKKLQENTRTVSYHALSHEELYSRIYRVYHDLGRWLWENSNETVESWYRELGEQRRREHIPLVEVLWALVLTKDRLVNYLDACGPVDTLFELYRQQEFDRIIGRFFDRAMCYTAEGYSRQPAVREKNGPAAVTH